MTATYENNGATLGGTVPTAGMLREALGRHLSRHFNEEVEIDRIERKTPGFSWLTYSFVLRRQRQNETRLILRLGPPTGLFAPYTVMPQVYALKAMADTNVPIPRLVSFSQDGAEVGLPFIICEFVDGTVPMPWAAASLDVDHRRRIARQFVRILSEIHRFDWKGSPIGALAVEASPRPELSRIALWRESLARNTARHYPLLEFGGRWLHANCPVAPRITTVHGDFRIGNFIEQDGNIVAVLDWELVHCGDPHEDLGWAFMPTFNCGTKKLYGVMERSEVLDSYESATGMAISKRSLAFYEAFALYQCAAIQMRAVRAFEIEGSTDMRMAAIGAQMASIVRAFDRALEAAA